MSTEQTPLDADHTGDRDRRVLQELFRAHTSPAFYRLAQQAAGIGPTREPTTSLATCEKVPTSDPERAANHPTEYELVEQVSDATEAIRVSIDRSRERQQKVLALIQEGEIAHAKRLALCGRKSTQLECPEMAGGCGSDKNFVPMHCDSRLCPDCMNRKMGRVAEQYRNEIASWDHPTMIRVSLSSRTEPADLERDLDALRGALGRLRRRVIPSEGKHQRRRWVWGSDGGQPANTRWKAALRSCGEAVLARRLQKRYIEQGRGIPFDEIVTRGFYGIDIKQKEDGRFNVHAHVLADVSYLPQGALSALWDDIIGAPAVDIRRVEDRGEKNEDGALMEVIGYAAKAPEFADVEDEVTYLTALKGSKLIQPFGELHGNTPDVSGLLRCCDCEQVPAYWDYVGTVEGCYSTAFVGGSAPDGDRPPPEGF